jgi:hypothetical protein
MVLSCVHCMIGPILVAQSMDALYATHQIFQQPLQRILLRRWSKEKCLEYGTCTPHITAHIHPSLDKHLASMALLLSACPREIPTALSKHHDVLFSNNSCVSKRNMCSECQSRRSDDALRMFATHGRTIGSFGQSWRYRKPAYAPDRWRKQLPARNEAWRI